MDKKKRLINRIRDKNTVECSNLKIIRIDGSLYFGSIERISAYFTTLYEDNEYQHVLISAEGINFIDLAAAEWLSSEIKKWQKKRGGIYLTGLKMVSQDVLIKGGFVEKMGRHIFYKDKKTAIKKIHEYFDTPCTTSAFDECKP